MKNKSIVFVLIGLFIFFNAQSTENSDSTKNELVLSSNYTSLSSITLKYGRKFGKDLWFRTGIYSNGDYQKEVAISSNIFNVYNVHNYIGFLLGIEKHKFTKMRNIEFVYGASFRCDIWNNISNTDNPALPSRLRTTTIYHYYLGLTFNLGLFYNFNEYFSIGSEMNPYVLYNFEKASYNKSTTSTTISYNILSNFSIFCLRFKW